MFLRGARQIGPLTLGVVFFFFQFKFVVRYKKCCNTFKDVQIMCKQGNPYNGDLDRAPQTHPR